MLRSILFFLALVGCGPSPSKPDVPPTPEQKASYDQAADRISSFYDQGFVVSRDSDGGEIDGEGDALLFTGLAVYSLDCERGKGPSDALALMVFNSGGALYRHPSLPDKASMDGAIEFYRAVNKRVTECGESAMWAPLIKKQIDYMHAHGGKLNAGDTASLPAGFDYLRDRLAANLGVSAAPSAARQAIVESAASAWAGADIAAKRACYRVHLALNALQTIEEMGQTVSPAAKDLFCKWTAGTDLPTTDHWCGRGDLGAWLDGFKYNEWEYRHQRCPAWEQPDGNGETRPAIDFLVGYADQHGVPK